MLLLVHQRIWKFVRSMIIRTLINVAWLLDFGSGFFQVCFKYDTHSFTTKLRNRAFDRLNIDIDIRGPAILKWFVTCFSAVASLLMQGTACIRLSGLLDVSNEFRWIYDGRVACFSDSGELPGRWQVAAAIGVAVVLVAPFILWRMMLGIQRLDQTLRSPFQQILLEAYFGPYFSHACHWMVVM
jgi:hypothetical protein